MPILSIVTQVLSLIPGLVAAGHDISGLVGQAVSAINSGSTDPTDAQWQALDAQVKALQAQLNA